MELQFNDLPKAISQILEKVDCLERLLLLMSKEVPQTDRWLDLNELVQYDPEKRTKPTFYGYIHRMEIPFHKRGKKLIFLKSEIDNWLKHGRRKTISEIGQEANTYIQLRNKK